MQNPDPHESDSSTEHEEVAGDYRRLRGRDLEALCRLMERGPLTIPEAYDCGHVDSESKGHGMNRLVAVGLVVFYGWDTAADDGLWNITVKGRRAIQAQNESTRT